jgi:hypothetical protein
MFLKKSEHSRKRAGAGILRLFLSFIIMGILGVGLLQAYRSFSGVDPFDLSPKNIAQNFLDSQKAYELITGLLSVSPSTSLEKVKEVLKDPSKATSPNTSQVAGENFTPTAPLAFKFAVVADSHNDNSNLKKALAQAKAQEAKFVIGLGDYTDVGTLDELKAAKAQFDSAGLPYYLTAGDHDLWDARNQKLPPSQNFIEVFGNPYQAFGYQNLRAILVYDSDNYLGLDSVQLKWLEDELNRDKEEDKLVLMFTSTPFYHPSSDHQLGRVNEKLKDQSAHLSSISKAAGVKEVIAGDTHMSARYVDSQNDLKMSTVGAVTSIKNPQTPRFAIVNVYQDNTYLIEDVEIQ